MKKLFIPIYITLAALSLHSCEQEQDLVTSGAIPATFLPAMGSGGAASPTRVKDNLWSGTETVGIAAFNAAGGTQYTSKFHKYVPASSTSGVSRVQLVPVSGETAILYPVSGDALTFTAFAPYPAASGNIATLNEANKTLTLGLGEQKSATGTNIMEQLDFIHHQGTDPYTQKAPVATLNFEHKLSRVVINLTRGASYTGSIASSTAKITGVFTTAVCNIATGALTSASGNGNITPFRTTDADANQVFQAIVAPQSSTSTPAATARKITITIDSKAYTLEMPEDWTSGNSYTYNYVFGPTGVALAGCTVTNWGGSTIDGNVLGLPPGWDADINWDTVVLDGESNCYIVPPNGQVLIPISRAKAFANNVSAELGEISVIEKGEEFYAKVLWSDNTKAIIDNRSVTRKLGSLTCIGTGPTGYILVETGAEAGNALVSLQKKKSDGTYITLWSWHIWVTDYNPWDTATRITTEDGTYGVMDRPLGATTLGDGSGLGYGLLYQWGRKTPFPPEVSGEKWTVVANGGPVALQHEAKLETVEVETGVDWNTVRGGTSSPCPAGWFVSRGKSDTDLAVYRSTSVIYGGVYENSSFSYDYWSYWPATDHSVYYLSSGRWAFAPSISGLYPNGTRVGSRTYASPVRCVSKY